MDPVKFDVFINNIMQFRMGLYDAFAPKALPISFESFGMQDFTENNWQRLREAIKQRGFTGLSISYGGTEKFTSKDWQSLFDLLKECNIVCLELRHERFELYDSTHWDVLATGIDSTNITLLLLSFFNIDKIGKNQKAWPHCLAFFQQLVKIEELSIQAFDTEVSNLCESFLDNLQYCPQFKRLMLCNNSLAHSAGDFWKISAARIAKTNIVHISLDSIDLDQISKDDWLSFCKGLQGSAVTSLSLQDNYLYNFTVEQWKYFFEGLANTPITELDIYEDHTPDFTDSSWEAFCHGLKQTYITKIHYKERHFSDVQKIRINEIIEMNKEKISSQQLKDTISSHPLVPEISIQIKKSPSQTSYATLHKPALSRDSLKENIDPNVGTEQPDKDRQNNNYNR